MAPPQGQHALQPAGENAQVVFKSGRFEARLETAVTPDGGEHAYERFCAPRSAHFERESGHAALGPSLSFEITILWSALQIGVS